MSIESAVAAIMAARPVFAIGDHVRVLDRPECRYCGFVYGLGNQPGRWDTPEELKVGRMAIVVSIDPPHTEPRCPLLDCDDEEEPECRAERHAHSVWVKFDVELPGDKEPGDDTDYGFDDHFAPEELEHIA